MGHYRSNIRDLEFTLFEVYGIQRRLGVGPFALADEDTARAVLREIDRLATGPLADAYADPDRNPPVFDPATHSVTLPDALKDSYQELWKGEWHRLSLPVALGGYGLPPTVQWAAAEILLGANAPLYMYFSAVGNCANILYRAGNATQRRWAAFMAERGWGATMVITEPDAGSDVGASRTRAVRQPDGGWHVEGVKRFITAGDQDITENILHLVLARPVAPNITPRPGVKGLSLFLVPKFLFDDATGAPRERNGVFVTNLERKMGLRGSATCEVALGQHGIPAQGWLLGDVHDGIGQMFEVIKWARMTVGTKSIGTLSTGYLNALEHARTRVQGSDLRQLLDKEAPRVTIIHHPDVRRLLMTQKAYAEGLRAVYLYAATFQDRVEAGDPDGEAAERVNDLLLPIVKGVGAERAYEQLAQSLQVLGGSGYLQDHPVEQYIRDSKIDSLYEGTTGIQSMDFFFRKIVRDGGASLALVTAEIDRFLAASRGEFGAEFAVETDLLARALVDVRAMVEALLGFLTAAVADSRAVYKIGQNSVRLLMSVGDLLVGWLLLRQAEVARDALAGGADRTADRDFYQGKIAVAGFFARTVLPELSARRRIVEAADLTLMEVPAAAF